MPESHVPQWSDRDAVLAKAKEFRQKRSETKEALRTRSLTLAEVFSDPHPMLAASKVFSLMWVVPGVGKVKTLNRLAELGLQDDVKIAELTLDHQASLVELAAGRLVVVSGPSGVGKGTVIRTLAEYTSFHLSVSATTREMRPGEVDGREYFFLSQEEFADWIENGKLLEWAEYAGNRYGTPRGAVADKLAAGHDVILEIEVQGARQVADAMPDAITVFILPPSVEELEARLLGRGDTSNIEERLETARTEMAQVDSFDHHVVNEDVDRAADELRSILRVLPRFRMN